MTTRTARARASGGSGGSGISGSPAEVEAALEEDEAASVVDPEFLAGEEAERNGHGLGGGDRGPSTPPPDEPPPGGSHDPQG